MAQIAKWKCQEEVGRSSNKGTVCQGAFNRWWGETTGLRFKAHSYIMVSLKNCTFILSIADYFSVYHLDVFLLGLYLNCTWWSLVSLRKLLLQRAKAFQAFAQLFCATVLAYNVQQVLCSFYFCLLLLLVVVVVICGRYNLMFLICKSDRWVFQAIFHGFIDVQLWIKQCGGHWLM